MRPFVPENPPLMKTEDGRILAEYLERQMVELSVSLDSAHDWDDARPVGGKPQEGSVRFIPVVDPLWRGSPGLYYYLNGSWVRIGDGQESTLAGHAGLYLSLATDHTDILVTGTPIQVTGFDAKIPDERGATADVSADTIVFTEPGIWYVSFLAVLDVTPGTANETRDMIAYFYNETEADPSFIVASGSVARYGATMTLAGGTLVPIGPSRVNDVIAVYVEALGSSINIEEAVTMAFSTFRVSNYESDGV